MKLTELLDYTGQLLQVDRYKDYCPNGLQVEGREEVTRIVSGVTASMALLQAAEAAGADMILVHHGYFWRGEDARVTGIRRARLKFLLERELNLVGYHLPLDAHPELGNNACLARALGLEIEGWFGGQSIAAFGRLNKPCALGEFQRQIEGALRHVPLVIGSDRTLIKRVAWCSGAAQDCMEEAVALGVDAFVTGEVSERTVHLANESGVAFIAAGHHATERFGVQALGEHLAQRFGIAHNFIDITIPV